MKKYIMILCLIVNMSVSQQMFAMEFQEEAATDPDEQLDFLYVAFINRYNEIADETNAISKAYHANNVINKNELNEALTKINTLKNEVTDSFSFIVEQYPNKRDSLLQIFGGLEQMKKRLTKLYATLLTS